MKVSFKLVARLGCALVAVAVMQFAGPGTPAHAEASPTVHAQAVASPADADLSLGSVVRIQSSNGKRCLDADSNSLGRDGSIVQLWDCFLNQANQEWRVIPAPGGIGFHGFQSVANPRYCLDADINHVGDGARVQMWTCNNSTEQAWSVDAAPNSRIWNEYFANTYGAFGPYVLDADINTIGRNGTFVQLWSNNGEPQQQWIVTDEAPVGGVDPMRCLTEWNDNESYLVDDWVSEVVADINGVLLTCGDVQKGIIHIADEESTGDVHPITPDTEAAFLRCFENIANGSQRPDDDLPDTRTRYEYTYDEQLNPLLLPVEQTAGLIKDNAGRFVYTMFTPMNTAHPQGNAWANCAGMVA